MNAGQKIIAVLVAVFAFFALAKLADKRPPAPDPFDPSIRRAVNRAIEKADNREPSLTDEQVRDLGERAYLQELKRRQELQR